MADITLTPISSTSGGNTNGTAGDDFITGTNLGDFIKGGQGRDTIDAGDGDDVIFGNGTVNGGRSDFNPLPLRFPSRDAIGVDADGETVYQVKFSTSRSRGMDMDFFGDEGETDTPFMNGTTVVTSGFRGDAIDGGAGNDTAFWTVSSMAKEVSITRFDNGTPDDASDDIFLILGDKVTNVEKAVFLVRTPTVSGDFGARNAGGIEVSLDQLPVGTTDIQLWVEEGESDQVGVVGIWVDPMFLIGLPVFGG